VVTGLLPLLEGACSMGLMREFKKRMAVREQREQRINKAVQLILTGFPPKKK